MNQEYYWESLFILFLTGFYIELLVHSQEICEILRTDLNQPLNLSVSVLHHSKIREISEISLMATRYPATLSELRSIHEISLLDPPVNHSIFRTEA